jgi:uncharacterized protein
VEAIPALGISTKLGECSRGMARTAKPVVRLDVIKSDPQANQILESAVAAGSKYIVSGDKDLPRLGSYDSIKILSVADFLDLTDR